MLVVHYSHYNKWKSLQPAHKDLMKRVLLKNPAYYCKIEKYSIRYYVISLLHIKSYELFSLNIMLSDILSYLLSLCGIKPYLLSLSDIIIKSYRYKI